MSHTNTLDSQAVLEAIKARRSFKIAALKTDDVAPELISTVLEAAQWAPSHGQTEPWHFTVFAGESRRALGDAFAEAYRQNCDDEGTVVPSTLEMHRGKVWNAPVWIALEFRPALRQDGQLKMPEIEELEAFSCSVQNLHLMASALGLGGQWSSNFTSTHDSVAQFLGIQAPARLMGFFFLGWPDIPWPQGNRAPQEEKVTWK